MTDLSNKYALAALKDRRARIAGNIIALKRQIERHRKELAHVDATLKLFSPGYEEGSIAAKAPRKRLDLFTHGQLSRLVLDALRKADGKPMTTAEVAGAVMATIGQGESARQVISLRLRASLCYLETQQKVVVKIGERHRAQ